MNNNSLGCKAFTLVLHTISNSLDETKSNILKQSLMIYGKLFNIFKFPNNFC